MYESEFTAALQAISENLTEECFDAIIEQATATLAETPGMAMDEAVHVAAANMFNDDVIDEAAFGVVDAVMNEFVNRPVGYQEALQAIAENCTEDEFDAIMTEAVTYALNEAKGTAQKRDEAIARQEKKLGRMMAKEDRKVGNQMVSEIKAENKNLKGALKQVKNAGGDAGSKAAAVRQLKDRIKANKKDITTVKNMADPNRKKKIAGAAVAGTAAAAVGAQSIYDKVKHGDALYTAKKAIAAGKEEGQKAIDAGKEAGQKALDAGKGAVDAAREKLSAKNESASEVYTLADLRALAEQ